MTRGSTNSRAAAGRRARRTPSGRATALAFALALLSGPAVADAQQQVEPCPNKNSPEDGAPAAEPKPRPGLEVDGRNALLPFTFGLQAPPGRKAAEVQIHIGVRLRLAEFRGWELYGFYRQSSFWQAYDFAASGPFRESNYSPGAFLRSRHFGKEWSGDFGYWHESNGRGLEEQDRSWDRLFARASWLRDGWSSSLTLWWRIPKPERVLNQGEPIPDRNADIYDYLGYGQWEGRWVRPGGLGAAVLVRLNPITWRGAINLEVSYPVSSFYVAAGWFDGYGESLVDYSTRIQRVSLGILITR